MDSDSFRDALEREGIVVFSAKDAARIISKPPGYTRLFLFRLAKRGKVLRVEKGKYCLQSANELEIASNLAYPSYVSFLSALAFHRLTTQIPIQVQVACTKQKKSVLFGNVRIAFIKLKRTAFFGFRRYGNMFVAEPEKAIIDGLYSPERLPLSEVLYALKQGIVGTGKLCEYAEKTGSSIVKRRLGLLLEKAGAAKGACGFKATATRYSNLNPLLGATGERDKKWMLIVNEVLE
ncbi:hypothetical protein HZC09_06660 [Candidatus Micrarchaeota archaeon]|nr:hypothetical protein [Candidatus Micrarchaeota archaeon]